ncbi:hypothetical protein JCM10207_007050 [Rhodosporidiobolus poonsookiae]
MLRLSLLVAAAATLASASPSPAPQPGFLGDLLNGVLNNVENKLHNALGLKACAAPFLQPESCINGESVATLKKNIDGCCTNTPGGLIMLTQFWNGGSQSIGPNTSWTIHGLWPDNCDGSYEQYCDPSREISSSYDVLNSFGRSDLVDYAKVNWRSNDGDDDGLMVHEFNKHATCISTLNATCYGRNYKKNYEAVDYFERAIDEHKKLPTYDWLAAAGIVPSADKTYTLAELQAVAKKQHGHKIYWGCSGSKLTEAWWYFHSKGPIAGGKLIPSEMAGSSSCPATGIQYQPKATDSAGNPTAGSGGSGSGSGSGSTKPTNGSKYFFNVSVDGKVNGCLISGGTWYTTGTCAGYTLAPTDKTITEITAGVPFTMTTSKGACTINAATELTCAATVVEGTTFTIDADGYLSYGDSPAFYTSAVPSGSTQAKVKTQADAVELRAQIGPVV